MNNLIEQLRQTDGNKRVAVLRIVAGLPLVIFGAMHLVDPSSFRTILEASHVPFVELNLIAAPITEIIAGLLLITGYLARLGGLAGAVTMFAAAWSTAILANKVTAPLGSTTVWANESKMSVTRDPGSTRVRAHLAYEFGDTVFMHGGVSAPHELHGYELILRNASTDSVAFSKDEHVHGTSFEFEDHWVNNVADHSDMEFSVIVTVDHEGTTETKKIEFY